ncbi:MAG TPA: hypothetical protein VF765_30845 [Polyangiaceae bacterium]
MRRCLHIALALLATAACGGGGSGAPSGSGRPLSVGDDDPAPPSRDNPGPSREPPSSSGGQSSGSSSGGSGCPCAGDYTCGVNGVDAGTVSFVITGTGASCSWSTGVGGTALQLGCNGMTTYQGYQYTSSWSGGSTIQLCATSSQTQTACITCSSAATPGG